MSNENHTIIVSSYKEYIKQYKKLDKKYKNNVFSTNDPETGLMSNMFITGKDNEDYINLEFYPFGILTENIIIAKSQNDYDNFYNAHHNHLRFCANAQPKQLCYHLICYCEAESKKISNILKIKLSFMKVGLFTQIQYLSNIPGYTYNSNIDHMFMDKQYLTLR